MRTFQLRRLIDVSGISGTGIIAVGIQFPNGTCVMQWQTNYPTLEIVNSIDDLMTIHGHGGATVMEWTYVTEPVA